MREMQRSTEILFDDCLSNRSINNWQICSIYPMIETCIIPLISLDWEDVNKQWYHCRYTNEKKKNDTVRNKYLMLFQAHTHIWSCTSTICSFILRHRHKRVVKQASHLSRQTTWLLVCSLRRHMEIFSTLIFFFFFFFLSNPRFLRKKERLIRWEQKKRIDRTHACTYDDDRFCSTIAAMKCMTQFFFQLLVGK